MVIQAAEAPGFPDFPAHRPVPGYVDDGTSSNGGGLPAASPYTRFSWKEFVDWPQPSDATAVASPVAKSTEEAILFPHVEVALSRDEKHNSVARHAAQTVYTNVYLREGYVQPSEVADDGIYRDKYDERSTYLYAENGKKVTAIRQIRATKKDGLLSLPTPQEFQIDPEVLKLAAGVDSLADLKPREVVEISGFASDRKERGQSGGFDATISIYSTMLRLAIEQGHKLWLQNTTPKVVGDLTALIGEDQLHQLGEPKMYMGSVTTPIAINPLEVIRKLLGSKDKDYDFHKKYLAEAFRGVDARSAPEDIRNLLTENNIEHLAPTRAYELRHNPKLLAKLGLLAYTGIRAFPVGQIDEFHGSPWIFWGIDTATVWPYAKGLEWMYSKNASVTKKVAGALIAFPSLIAPYAYLYAEGNGYPAWLNTFIGTLAAGSITKDIISRIRGPRREAALHAALRAPKA